MIDVKENFKNMYGGNLGCHLCGENVVQSQSHLIICDKILENCQDAFENVLIEHDDIYGNIETQLIVTRLYQKVLECYDELSDA